MKDIIETLTARLNQIRFSDDDFNTKLNTISSIQTEFDEYVNSLFFLKKIINRKSIKSFNDAVEYAKNQIERYKLTKPIYDDRTESYITDSQKLINDYRTESQKLIDKNNCLEDENAAQIEEIIKKGDLVINHHKLFKRKNNLTADLSAEYIDRINNLIGSFEYIQDQTTDKYSRQLKICEKIKIIKDGNYKVVNELIKDKDLYYIYDSETKIVTLLGQYKETIQHKIHDAASLSVFVFENNGTTVKINANKLKNLEILIKEPVNPEDIELIVPSGGKPRRTRRHKNKKRRSSKQQKSKK